MNTAPKLSEAIETLRKYRNNGSVRIWDMDASIDVVLAALAPPSGEGMGLTVVHREILENADAALSISNHKGSAWSEHESPRYEIRELLGLPYEKRTTPPPASQERGGDASVAKLFTTEKESKRRAELQVAICGAMRMAGATPSSEVDDYPKTEGDRITAQNEAFDIAEAYAAEQAKPDDCPFCGQPQHYTDEDCPILSRAHTTVVADQAQAGELPMTDGEVERWIDACNYENARQVLRNYLRLRRLAGGVTPEMTKAALNAQPFANELSNDAIRVWQLIIGDNADVVIHAALVAALGAK